MSGKTSGKIIDLIKNNAHLSIPELASQIGVSERSIERNIHNLQNDGYLMRIGPARGGYCKVIEKE